MSITIQIIEPRIELVFSDDAVVVAAAAIDTDTVLGRAPGSIGLTILELTSYAPLAAALGGIDYLTADSIAAQRVAALAKSVASAAAASSGETYLQADAIATARVAGFMRNAQFQTAVASGSVDEFTIVQTSRFFGS